MKDTIVSWEDSYSVNINLIDDQHKELIDLTNKLFRSCLKGQQESQSVFLDIIHEVVDYVAYHFGTEEKIMEQVNYPEFQDHKKEHIEFVREVFRKVEEFGARKVVAPISFVYYLRNWVLHHIAERDKKLGTFLVGMRNSGELQKLNIKIKSHKTSDWTTIE